MKRAAGAAIAAEGAGTGPPPFRRFTEETFNLLAKNDLRVSHRGLVKALSRL